MVGGMKRRTPPRELARDPETWPEADLTDPGAVAVQDIARTLAAAISECGLSLRALAEASGVNRQAIADLLARRRHRRPTRCRTRRTAVSPNHQKRKK
ncbi:XRE family transcriptional regulator [Streptomyces sp. C11-1]|uniref:XRE family transcriptional regulator n=1 Tax=Streptomyces durocortorensis TaxID=2811104 RepID=A0ABY9W779_9ACTN|nr:XRE family transcriptional regulator [Streptomyces durocortorensis]WNF31057.1 XRE family transcriptional regulator [Streptomyces durocortorensis]